MGDPDSFEHLMASFRRTAFKLEVRRSYGIASEDAAFQDFRNGREPGIDWLSDWLDSARRHTAAGKRIERVRVVDDPPSDFLRFELTITPHNLAAGEDIRYLSRDKAAQLSLPHQDFWIFDEATVLVVHFAGDDTFTGVESIKESSVVRRYLAAREAAWQHALPYASYLSSSSKP